MKLEDITIFRKDLLFHGAAQLGWFERNKTLSNKAATHFIFHGPDYHGTGVEDEPELQLTDTASFTFDIAKTLTGQTSDDPFTLAVAGYGTGKSHYALALATLFASPESGFSRKILSNLVLADKKIGNQVTNLVSNLNGQPHLVITLNGMEDFDLGGEILRQIFAILNEKGLETGVLEKLRPRFEMAKNFAVSFHEPLKSDFQSSFGVEYRVEDIINSLGTQNEQVFEKVNDIYAHKMGSAFQAVGQESLQDFIRVTQETFCGKGKPFAGILIIFDEFGRYLEFAVQKPHIAGPAALQQLFEAVQENGDRVFLLSFIQSELKAYASRVAPERREEINRYIGRFNAVRKTRLSTNLETVIANLLEKKDPETITKHLAAYAASLDHVQSCMSKWFPDITNHSLWVNPHSFHKIVCEGCWPLHPLSTWVLFKLAAIGKSLQQRSALSLLAEVFEIFKDKEFKLGQAILPIDLLTEGLISEFVASESIGAQSAITYAYQSVLQKYQHELEYVEKAALKSIVLQQKIGIKVRDKDDYIQALSMFSGMCEKDAENSVNILEKEYGVLEWNGVLCQYEIVGNAIPRKSFLTLLYVKTEVIDSLARTKIFRTCCKQWLGIEEYNTDFGENADIYTKEWGYNTYFTNTDLLKKQIQSALRSWRAAIEVDINKGQLIYCYVGPESNLSLLQERAAKTIKEQLALSNINSGAPLAVIFLYDSDGEFGQCLAEYWIIEQGMSVEEKNRYINFVADRQAVILQELEFRFAGMEKERNVLVGAEVQISQGRLKQTLEDLFNAIYPARIPFPFDGFYTARGNAAKDSQLFTRELFLGKLDREWLKARNQQQRNRGYSVLDKSWAIFDEDGTVRLLPLNIQVRDALKILDLKLQDDDEDKVNPSANLGEVVRAWLLPPYGCNMAIAGLLLAIYIGRRKDELELYVDDKIITVENWLAEAMTKNSFDLAKLDHTKLERVSKEKLSEWEIFLEEWQIEPTYKGKIYYKNKAKELQIRLPIPQKLQYKYQHICSQANEAIRKLNRLDNNLNSALQKIETAESKDDANYYSWAAAILAVELQNIKASEECWTKEQAREIEEHYISARIKAKQTFPKWLNGQRVTSLEYLGKFKHRMLEQTGKNLEIIGLIEEREALVNHVGEVEKNVRYLAEIKESIDNTKKLTDNNVSEELPVVELQSWIDEASQLQSNLQAARERTNIAKHEINEATKILEQFSAKCYDQIQKHKARAGSIFDHRKISELGDITAWKVEVLELTRVFAGQEKDIEDLKCVAKQLELTERHYNLLNQESLTDSELTETLDRCLGEIAESFIDDQPPLDSELIFSNIMSLAKDYRSKLAIDWLNIVLPKTRGIQAAAASQIIETKKQLEKMPAVLSQEQRARILTEIQACDKRLDEMEVEGLLAQFEAFSKDNKTTFLKKLVSYLEKHFPSGEFKFPFSG